MVAQTDRLPLAEAVTGLRRELRAAAERAMSLPAVERFRITEAEIELAVVAEQSTEGGFEVGWCILKGGVKDSGKDAISHTLRLKLDVGAIEVGSAERTG
jgi:hypothetical protein